MERKRKRDRRGELPYLIYKDARCPLIHHLSLSAIRNAGYNARLITVEVDHEASPTCGLKS